MWGWNLLLVCPPAPEDEDTMGLAPDHSHEVSWNLFAGGGPCLQLVKKNTTSVKYNKTRCVHICHHVQAQPQIKVEQAMEMITGGWEERKQERS